MQAIETANPDTLTGVFGDGDWGNKDLLSDRILVDLVEHFSSRTLSVANLPEDELGQGYEFLIKKFADDSGHTAQEFYTNRTLVHLMTMMLEPHSGESIYDPTCGTGGMLISAAAEVRRQGREWRNLRLYGQELNHGTSAIARMNLFLNGVADGEIAHGDTLAEPAFLDPSGQLRTFDVVLANPPYSIKNWNRAKFTKDPFGRNTWGVPPQGRADYAFFQHIAHSLDPETGRAATSSPTAFSSAARRPNCAGPSLGPTCWKPSLASDQASSTTRPWRRLSSPSEPTSRPNIEVEFSSSTPSMRSPASRRNPSSGRSISSASSRPTAPSRTRTGLLPSLPVTRLPPGAITSPSPSMWLAALPSLIRMRLG